MTKWWVIKKRSGVYVREFVPHRFWGQWKYIRHFGLKRDFLLVKTAKEWIAEQSIEQKDDYEDMV